MKYLLLLFAIMFYMIWHFEFPNNVKIKEMLNQLDKDWFSFMAGVMVGMCLTIAGYIFFNYFQK